MKLLALTSLFSLAQAWYGEQGYLATQVTHSFHCMIASEVDLFV